MTPPLVPRGSMAAHLRRAAPPVGMGEGGDSPLPRQAPAAPRWWMLASTRHTATCSSAVMPSTAMAACSFANATLAFCFSSGCRKRWGYVGGPKRMGTYSWPGRGGTMWGHRAMGASLHREPGASDTEYHNCSLSPNLWHQQSSRPRRALSAAAANTCGSRLALELLNGD